MKQKSLLIIVSMTFISVFIGLALIQQTEAARASGKTAGPQKSCTACHTEFASLLPKTHPFVKVTALDACMDCHAIDHRGRAEPNKFGTRLHLAHLNGRTKTDSLVCHIWQPNKQFGLVGATESYGAPSEEEMGLQKQMFTSAAKSTYLDARHISKNIICSGCQGQEQPGRQSTIQNARCLECQALWINWRQGQRQRISLTEIPANLIWVKSPARLAIPDMLNQKFAAWSAIRNLI